MGAEIGPSRAGFELAVVFDRRRDPTALLILLRQFCLALPPVLDIRFVLLVTREPSVDAANVEPVRGVSGPVGEAGLGDILKIDFGYPRIGLVGLNGMESVVRMMASRER
jgi:hypothetical protein